MWSRLGEAFALALVAVMLAVAAGCTSASEDVRDGLKSAPVTSTPVVTLSSNAGLADSAWPAFGHDVRQTRRSANRGPVTPERKWRYHIGIPFADTSGLRISSPATGVDGAIYVGSGDNRLWAISPDGSKRWEFSMGHPVLSSPAIGADGTIYVDEGIALWAINPDGTEKWAFRTGKEPSPPPAFGVRWPLSISASPVIGSDGTVYTGGADGRLYAVNSDGTEKWAFAAESAINSTAPAIGDDGTIYVVDEEGLLHAVGSDGTERWAVSTGAPWSSPAIGDDGTIYVCGSGLMAFNPDGSPKWTFAPEGAGGPISPAIGRDGTIYFGSHERGLYAVNPDGTKKWQTLVDSFDVSTPVVDADETIYVGTRDNKTYALNADGTERWNLDTDNPYAPTIGAGGTLYFVTHGGGLLAIGNKK
jgi:outer membrane protein assembly factor BamB